MKVLVIGSGAREHALVWKIAQSKRVKKIYSAPGNPGISRHAECIDIKTDNISALLEFAKREKIDLTIVGPELPLTLGIVDLFDKEALPIFGPSKLASEIEGSKVFSKRIMRISGIPTADAMVFESKEEAINYIREKSFPAVIKADGLAQGKGVIIADNINEAYSAIESILVKRIFGDAGRKIIIEDFLHGEEATFHVFTDGESIVPMVSSQDHKRLYDGDNGPNTGGMGAIAPTPLIDKKDEEKIINQIIRPIIKGMEMEGRRYRGILYAGLMICKDGPKVLEFNARLGDPEAEVVLPLLDTDLIDIIESIIYGRLDGLDIRWKDRTSVCVVLASKGYPAGYVKGVEIRGLAAWKTKRLRMRKLDGVEDLMVFHAGTSIENGRLVTSGGRVLCISAIGEDITEARDRAYFAVSKINFDGMHFRRDIGATAINKID